MNTDTAAILSYPITLCLAMLLIRSRKRAEYYGLKAGKGNSSIIIFLFPLIFIPMSNLMYLFAERWISPNIYMAVLSGIYIGIMEELIFRAFLFRAIEERLNDKWAIIISSVLFGLYHLVNLTAMPIELVAVQVTYAAAIGISFAIVFYITGSIIPCIIIHALTDILAYIFAENMLIGLEVAGMFITVFLVLFYCMIYAKHTADIKLLKQ